MTKPELLRKQELSLDAIKYGTNRFDILTVSVSGGGIYICIDTFKYLKGIEEPYSLLLPFAGLAFLLGITMNFISQMTSTNASQHEYLALEVEIEKMDKINELDEIETEELEEEKDGHDAKSETYYKVTEILNYSSTTAMFLGLLLLAWYFCTT
jgi:23S rRNA maturation mini-RNase III